MAIDETSRKAPTAASPELLQELLEETSRTFALAIPMLPQPVRGEVTIAYLLFRIADTFEDATVLWSRAERSEALRGLAGILETPEPAERAVPLVGRWRSRPPIDHSGYLRLLELTPDVLASLGALEGGARDVVRHHTVRTALGMAEFVDRTGEDGVLRLTDLADLRAYCYVVAGIVGEMLTDLFLLSVPALQSIGDRLRTRAALFGEGLQLTNILKDSAWDHVEGRNFVPPAIDRAEVFALARRDLEAAEEYCLALQEAGAPSGLVAFTALTVGLAEPTLSKVEAHGPGSKISRARVALVHQRIRRALAAGRPVFER
ncbi:MAG: squalene/phytoene synthase family protein [Thermoanaerobaculia bacterium]